MASGHHELSACLESLLSLREHDYLTSEDIQKEASRTTGGAGFRYVIIQQSPEATPFVAVFKKTSGHLFIRGLLMRKINPEPTILGSGVIHLFEDEIRIEVGGATEQRILPREHIPFIQNRLVPLIPSLTQKTWSLHFIFAKLTSDLFPNDEMLTALAMQYRQLPFTSASYQKWREFLK